MQMIDTLPSPPTRPASAHKGTFGRVLIIGGSRGMSGAPSLSGLGALRGGAGLVYVAVPSEILPIVATIDADGWRAVSDSDLEAVFLSIQEEVRSR